MVLSPLTPEQTFTFGACMNVRSHVCGYTCSSLLSAVRDDVRPSSNNLPDGPCCTQGQVNLRLAVSVLASSPAVSAAATAGLSRARKARPAS
eukprot:1770809-Rhodomonas_salina.1